MAVVTINHNYKLQASLWYSQQQLVKNIPWTCVAENKILKPKWNYHVKPAANTLDVSSFHGKTKMRSMLSRENKTRESQILQNACKQKSTLINATEWFEKMKNNILKRPWNIVSALVELIYLVP